MNQNYDDIVEDGIDTQDERSNAKVEALEINNGTSQVATLNGYHLYDNGHRVYCGNFKPRLTDLGNIADLGGFKADGSVSNVEDSAGSVPWTANSGVYNNRVPGASNMVIQFRGTGGSNPATQFKVGYQNGGIWYRSARDGHGFEQDWSQIYTSKHKPTANDVGALPITGGRVSGELTIDTINNSTTAHMIRYAAAHGSTIVGNGNSPLYLDSRDSVIKVRNAAGNEQTVYHTGNKPTANDVGSLAGVTGRPLRIPSASDQWQVLARVRIPQGGATARFTVIGGAGFNSAESNAGNNTQSTLHDIVIRSGNNAPKGLNCTLYGFAGANHAVTKVGWKAVSGDEFDIYVRTGGSVHIHGVFVTGQFSDNATLVSWGTDTPSSTQPAGIVMGYEWKSITDAGGTMAGTLGSSRKAGQFKGPQCGGTRLNDLYSTDSGQWSYVSNVNHNHTDAFPTSNNANGVLTFNTHHGDYGHQLGMSSNGKLYHRWWKDTTWKEIVRAETNGTLNVTALGVTNGAAVGTLSVAGAATINGIINTPAADFIRSTYNNQYGLIHRNDGVSYYMLLTNRGDVNGGWNALRPFRLDLANGRIYVANGLSANSVSVDGTIYSGGAVVTDNTPNATHSMTMMSNDTNSASKNFLRKWRNYNAGTIWHETIEGNIYRIATGSTDSNQLLGLTGNGELYINGPVYSSRHASGASSALIARNTGTTPGVTQAQLEVHGNGNINLTTHNGSGWFYPVQMFRDSANIQFNGLADIRGGVASHGAFRFKQQGGADGDVWLKLWGSTANGRKRILEVQDNDGWHFYSQRINSGIQFAVNGRISSGNTYVGSSGAPFLLDDAATLGAGMNNALLRGAIAGGGWDDWKTRASGLHINVGNSANEAYNVWKVQQPGSDNIAAVQVHRPGGDQARTMVRIQSGNDGRFDFHGNGVLRCRAIETSGDVISHGNVSVRSDFITIRKDGRRHFAFSNAAGAYDMYMWKDTGGDGIHLTNGTDGGGDWIFKKDGSLHAPGNGSFNDVQVRSDARLKTELQPITGAVSKVLQLTGYTYDKHERISAVAQTVADGGIVSREAGIIAQDLEAVLPEAVKMTVDSDGEPIRTVSPAATIALLVEAVKELKAEIEILKAK
ncbi:tail fiber domain-containing protein [Edwardsiella tarda]|uniref:tail fiber domain-containing protein n=1 Tax=Edwardsiella tarda TaxID=636 RepID=UPI00083B5B5F|nr:tail fiber domain-containing protein [Edwardsiella tarda]